MKKVLPFIFPLLALLIVLFLGYRWYTARTQRNGEISSFGEGVQIEDLTGTDQERILRGSNDFKKVSLVGEGDNSGEVRYEIKDGKFIFTVAGLLPELSEGEYQVWLKKEGSDEVRKAFVLDYSKSGHTGSAQVSVDVLPVEIIVSKELRPDNTIEMVVLRATVRPEGK